MFKKTEAILEKEARVTQLEEKISALECDRMLAEDLRKRCMEEAVRDIAKSVIAENPVIVALGTSGTDVRNGHDIVEIVVVDMSGDVLFRGLAKPRADIESGATECHGHTAESLADAPSLADALRGYAAAVAGKRVIAWSGKFERWALEESAERVELLTSSLPMPRFVREGEGDDQYKRELDSIQRLAGALAGDPYVKHNSKDRTPSGVAETARGRLIWLSERYVPTEEELREDWIPI